MKNTISIISTIVILLFSNVSSYSEELDHLPGYKLNKSKIDFLKDYKIEADKISYVGVDLYGIKRHLVLINKDTTLHIDIYISQDQKLTTKKIFEKVLNEPGRATGFSLNKQDHKNIGIGEALYTYEKNIKNKIEFKLIFSRNNIVVKITDKSSKTKIDLKLLGQQIDKNIDNQIKVTFKEIASHKPIIEKFNLDKDQLKEYTENKLTIKISDPNKLKTSVFFESNGEVTKNNGNYIFDSSSASQKETLTIIVVNDQLLYSKKTIEFTVIK